jgi:Dyp-type peroxidase family
MENIIDFHDVQGNIMINYAEFGYFKSRYLFIEVKHIDCGRAFVKDLIPLVTPSVLSKNTILPAATLNISFTYNGLKELGLPQLTLQSFPEEYAMGIRNRTAILDDIGTSKPDNWDEVYREDIHILISIDARNDEDIEKRFQEIEKIIAKHSDEKGIRLIEGCKNTDKSITKYQEASVLYSEKGYPTAKEHFGYTDGISNPFFKGMTEEMGDVMGGGKKIAYGDPKCPANWGAIETGEFILGYRDEANEYPAASIPKLLSKNGSFMVFNKFHENVGKFNEYLDSATEKYGIEKEELAAKFVGRWRNGAPITSFPKKEDADNIALERQKAYSAINKATTAEEVEIAKAKFNEINKHFTAFDYDEDIKGSRCPVGAHARRANPRGSLEFGNKEAFDTPAALDNRRRLIRRGLPYGTSTPESNDGEHGTIIITIVANIKRQFEFVIQQWLNYSNDFNLANDKDTITGNQEKDNGRMVIEGDEKTPPKFLMNIPQFIETRGGVYLFIPSITALNLIADGMVDPT